MDMVFSHGTDKSEKKPLVALAGNPNVGKSTLFNRLTGMRQHTGNWPGKTVGIAYGHCTYKDKTYTIADIPGAYSLIALSADEEAARDFICYAGADAVLVVCDATCLRRNLNLVLQIMEITGNVIICVNLMDEAKRKGIRLDLPELSRRIGAPVAGLSAGRGEGIDELMEALYNLKPRPLLLLDYGPDVEYAISPLVEELEGRSLPFPARWLALRLAEKDASTMKSIEENLDIYPDTDPGLARAMEEAERRLRERDISQTQLSDMVAARLVEKALELCNGAVSPDDESFIKRDRKIDAILTHKVLGYPVMVALLALTLWLTISGANYPSELLGRGLFWLGNRLQALFSGWGVPHLIVDALFDGVWRTLVWVVSVMLPPMAIFFPLFTLLEDLGYLPRVAFNLDGFFKKCSACGKQALTMCMGFGCNAAGVTGCRIINSPRERLIAILTNNFVPCNGRFPTLIALIAIFFAGAAFSLVPAVMLTGTMLLGVLMTMLTSKLLSVTILRGVPSSFTLELPPYRKPRVLQVILRSIMDRTLFVLGRAVIVAAPAGLVIWILGNTGFGGASLLSILSEALDPIGRFFGMDGVIMLAFILGLPANEIVIPIILMCYLSGSSLMDYTSLEELGSLLVQNGWTSKTALCVMLFSLMHWPCSTTLITIKKETGSLAYTALAALLPTVFGLFFCFLAARLF
ncbi:MAG: ferrous iron transport protein B [Oscillospiraceae bacterium]|jgi:ferrous iron transport protein B